MKTTQTQISF